MKNFFLLLTFILCFSCANKVEDPQVVDPDLEKTAAEHPSTMPEGNVPNRSDSHTDDDLSKAHYRSESPVSAYDPTLEQVPVPDQKVNSPKDNKKDKKKVDQHNSGIKDSSEDDTSAPVKDEKKDEVYNHNLY